jgi:hypothetical protein
MIARPIIVFLLALLVHGGSALAHGFCDDIQPPPRGIDAPTGGYCHQARATFLQNGLVMPDTSSTNLPYTAGAQAPVAFILAIDKLHLPAQHGGSYADVFELDIAHMGGNGPCCGDTRTLAMQILRLADGSSALQWDWHASTPTPSPQDQTVSMPIPATTDMLVVQITPGPNGSRFGVDVQTFDSLQSKRLSEQSAAFSMSVWGDLQNAPMRMRSGVIDGDLAAPGMQTTYWFLSPSVE